MLIYNRTHHDLAYSVFHGDYREILPTLDRADDGKVCDAVIADPPFSDRTHSAYEAMPSVGRSNIKFDSFTPEQIRQFICDANDAARGWVVVMTDHILASHCESEAKRLGRYPFSPLAVVRIGANVRIRGDGPAQWSVQLCVSRPCTREFSSWGALPGAYLQPNKGDTAIAGGKTIETMRAIVRDYSRNGDLVLDCFGGGGTTGIACIQEGRGAILIERDKGRAEYCAARVDEEIEAIHRAPELWPVRRGQLKLGVSK